MLKIKMPPKIELPTDKTVQQLITKQLFEIAKSFVSKVQNNIVEQKIIDRGTLLKSVKILKIDENQLDVVNTDAKAIYIEKGRAPGTFPPVESLYEWIVRKGVGSDIKTTKDLKAARRLLRKEPKKMAFAIAKKIKKEGIKERPFWKPAITWIEEKRAEKILKNIGKKIIEKIK